MKITTVPEWGKIHQVLGAAAGTGVCSHEKLVLWPHFFPGVHQFSVERLLRFLVALDQDVEIVVKPHRDRNNAPALQVF